LVRHERQSDTFLTALKSGFTPEAIRYFSKGRLTQTPRSLDVPVDYGGLGDIFRKEKQTIMDHLIYVFEKRKRCRVVATKHVVRELRILQVPLFAAKELKLKEARLKVSDDQLQFEVDEDAEPLGAQRFPYKEFKRFEKWAHSRDNKHFFECVVRMDLRKERPLSLMKTVTVVLRSDFEYARLNNLVEQEYSKFHSIGEKSNAKVRTVRSILERRREKRPLNAITGEGPSTLPLGRRQRPSPLLRDESASLSTSSDDAPTREERYNNPLVYGSTLSLLHEFGP